MNPIRLTLIALFAAVALAGCESAQIERTLAVLQNKPVPPPTADEIAAFSQYLDENPDLKAKLVGDLTEGSVVVSALISSAQLESSSEPVSSEVVVAVVEPPKPPPCDPVQWRGNWYSCDMMVLIGPVE